MTSNCCNGGGGGESANMEDNGGCFCLGFSKWLGHKWVWVVAAILGLMVAGSITSASMSFGGSSKA